MDVAVTAAESRGAHADRSGRRQYIHMLVCRRNGDRMEHLHGRDLSGTLVSHRRMPTLERPHAAGARYNYRGTRS
jgi:hypothetical protein